MAVCSICITVDMTERCLYQFFVEPDEISGTAIDQKIERKEVSVRVMSVGVLPIEWKFRLGSFVSRTFPLRGAHLAHTLSQSGHGRGRIVLPIAE